MTHADPVTYVDPVSIEYLTERAMASSGLAVSGIAPNQRWLVIADLDGDPVALFAPTPDLVIALGRKIIRLGKDARKGDQELAQPGD